MVNFFEEAQAIGSKIIGWRRDFHQHPEPGFEEVRTAGIIADHLRSLGIETRTGVGKTGVVGILTGTGDGPVIMLRFDIDALPIQQESDLEYASVYPGRLHGCGHDGHAAIGMGTASLLARHKDAFRGKVLFIFQPAEETTNGAQSMVDDGALNPMPDMCFGLHLHSRTPIGHIKVEEGPIMSAADTFRLTIHGKGGHGAEPQDTVDPILTAAQIINALQTIVSRNVNPLDVAVVGIGSIHAGDAANVIPDVCELTGTIRTYLPETRQLVHRRIGEISRGVAEINGARSEFELIESVPATVNDPKITRELIPLLEKMLGSDKIEGGQRSTPSEDMSIFLQLIPGTYFVLGAGGPEYPPHHSPQFRWDDSVLPLGAAMMAGIVSHFSQKGQ